MSKITLIGGLVAVAAVALVASALDLHPALLQLAHGTDLVTAMAVVTKYGTGAKDPAVLTNVEQVFAGGEYRAMNSKISIANGDSATSVFYFGKIPSNAIIDPFSQYDYSAITTLSDFDIGFLNDPDALVDGDDVTAAGTQTLRGHGTLTLANSNKRAWELAGYSTDPGGDLDIIGTMKAAATAAGTIVLTLRFSRTT